MIKYKINYIKFRDLERWRKRKCRFEHTTVALREQGNCKRKDEDDLHRRC